MTQPQARMAERIVTFAEKSCRHDFRLASKDKVARTMAQWATTPEVCACKATALRAALTPAVMALDEQAFGHALLKITLETGALCEVPVFKTQFATGCEDLYSAEPYKRADIARMCSCMRPAIAALTVRQWTDSVLAVQQAFDAAGPGQRGLPELPAHVVDEVAERCMGPDAARVDAPPR